MASDQTAIRGIELSKSFRFYQVLRAISFDIKAGECYVLTGPNGAGKTTLLKILATLASPSSGRFEIMGYDGVNQRAAVREALWLVGHRPYLYDELTATENILFAVGLRGRRPPAQEIKAVLDRVGLGPYATLKSREYSEGMKRRLSVATAILIRPQVLLLDEAYASLDDRGAEILNTYIREATQEGVAVLMATHDRERPAKVADRVGFLSHGVLRETTLQEWAARA